MPSGAISDALLQATVNALAAGKTQSGAAKLLGLPRTTVQGRLDEARARGITPNGAKLEVDGAQCVHADFAHVVRLGQPFGL